MADPAAARTLEAHTKDRVAELVRGAFPYAVHAFACGPLSDAIDHQVGGGTPSRRVAAYWNGDIPWASVKDFSDAAVVLSRTEESISQTGLDASASNLIPAGVPLVCTRMAVGRAVLSGMPVAINQDVKALFPHSETDSGYLVRLLHYVQPKAEAVSVGSTVKGIRVQDYLALPVPQAPPNEQPLIARVLDSLDAAIHHTESIIAKLKRVKQGLLHDLLTRGIDANGELRPPQSEAPHLYKPSPLGWIPKEWRVSGLADVAPVDRSVIRTGPFGSSLKDEHWRDSGTPVVTIGSLGDGTFITPELLYVDDDSVARLIDFTLIPGDLVFSRVADVGRSVVISDEERGWIMSSNFMRISCDGGKVRPRFLQALLSDSHPVRKQLRMSVNSAGRDVANSDVLLGLRFPWPELGEQDEILRRVHAVSADAAAEDVQMGKLLRVKSGLMDDLLTGRVRVTPLLEPAATP